MNKEEMKDLEKQFKVGYRYLVKNTDSHYYTILELTVLEVSKKAVKVKFQNDNTVWYLKDNLVSLFIEELPILKQTIEDRSHEIQFEDDIEVKLKSEEKPKLEWQKVYLLYKT